MIRFAVLLFLAVPLILVTPSPAQAQRETAVTVPLEVFVQRVARLWANAEAGGIATLAPADGRILLEIGGETSAVQARHAAAAFRALFADRQSISVRPARVTIAGDSPPQGFGEISWTFRSRGVSNPQTQTLYIGAVWEGRGWRITELRLIP
ncbi:MAG TPA: hypothetical protein VFI91_09310 [Longimicrobiaceae bacterium]|nr:hypothetical protein [Longimicrobiaceae bacterium]